MPHRQRYEEELEEELPPRAQARRNIQARRHFQNSLVGMIVISAFLVVMWAVSGLGYFWPGWVIGAFVVVMVLRYARSQRGPISQKDIEEETHRIQSER